MSVLASDSTVGSRPRAARRRGGVMQLLLSRLAMALVTLVVSSFAVFSSLYLAPGGPIAALSKGRTLTPQMVASLEAEYHLNDPFLVRYVSWLGDLLHGDLGNSFMYHQSVTSMIGDRMGVTFELAAYSGVLIVVFGIGSGVLAGLRRGLVDSAIVVFTTVFAAIPAFVTAIALLYFFAVSLGWFPTLGPGRGFLDGLWHLTLPAVALALGSLALVSRVTRAAVRTELDRDHVQTAVSRGIPYPTLIRRHVLRNAMIPITTVVGLSIASLIVLTAIVEQAFGLSGLGSAMVQAASYGDVPVVQGIALVYVVVFVATNTLVDLVYGFLDPRIRIGRSQ